MNERTLSERVSDALADALTQHGDGRMLLRSLVVFEALNTDGERTISVVTSPDMRAWDTMGLAQWANECAVTVLHGELNGH